MNRYRALLWFDAVATYIGAALCLVAPQAFVAGYFTTPLDSTGLAIVRWLGLMFVAFATMEVRGLLEGDRAFWRVVLPAFVAGDSLHFVGTVMRTFDPHFHWTSTSVSDAVLVALYLPLRIWLALHPERLDRAER